MAIVLREYQSILKPPIYEAWNRGQQNVLLVMPTGAGKTKFFCSTVVDLAVTPLNKFPTAIAVHRKELVQQISLTLAEEGITHNIIAPKPVIMGIVAAQRKLLNRQFYDYNSNISVISVDTLNARIDTHHKWAATIKYWITDEAAHLLKNNKWGQVVSYFPNAIGLGVTATPQRLDKRGLGRHADGVFDVMVQGPTTRWLIANGFLCKYKIAIPKSDYEQHLGKANEGHDFSKGMLLKASRDSSIVGDAVRDYKKFANGLQSILFTDSIETGSRMEKKFLEAGIKAKFLHSDISDAERLQALIDYRDKELQVLLNVDLFDEGLDVPGIQCVQMCRKTMSLGKYLQMIGRGLRPAKGKEHLIIIDHVGNVMQHGLPDQHREWTLDRIVKRRDTVNLLRICQNWTCSSPFDRFLHECPYCGTGFHTGYGARDSVGKLTLKEVDGDLELLDEETLRAMFDNCQLEDPAEIGKRVGNAVNSAAGIKAMKAQIERIEMQKELSDVIAHWAGRQRQNGYTDRQINKKFFVYFGMSITGALSEPKAAMESTMENVKEFRG